jgi:anti-anti-sigma factor
LTQIPLSVRGEEPMTPGFDNQSERFGGRPEPVGHPRPSPSLTVELHLLGATCVLALAGDLVATTVAALEAQLEQLAYLPARDVVLDLVNLATLDAVGSSVLVGLSHYARGRGGHMTTMGANESVAGRLAGTPLGSDRPPLE